MKFEPDPVTKCLEIDCRRRCKESLNACGFRNADCGVDYFTEAAGFSPALEGGILPLWPSSKFQKSGGYGQLTRSAGRLPVILHFIQGVFLWPLLCICTLMCAGCHTTEKSTAEKPNSSAWASVQIHGNTPGQIGQATAEVFKEHGFTRAGQPKGGLVFEKEASKFSNLAYGNWVGDIPLWTRVKISIVPAGEATYNLECTAFNVRDRGGATEEEIKIHMGKGNYQKLLDEVAARFKK